MSAAAFITALMDELPERMNLHACAVLLVVVDAPEPLTSKQVASRVGISPAGVCRAMDTLEALKYARRVRGPTWRKRRLVEPMRAGREFADRVNAALPPAPAQIGKVSA